MDLRDLAYFEVIAETGHLGRAADRLGRTQPALTKCLQRLEAAIGAELFARAGRGIALTKVGEVLLGYARQMRSTMDTSLRDVKAFASGEAGHVRIGTGPTMAEYLLPQVCSNLIALLQISRSGSSSEWMRSCARLCGQADDLWSVQCLQVRSGNSRSMSSVGTKLWWWQPMGTRCAAVRSPSTTSRLTDGFCRTVQLRCANGWTGCLRRTVFWDLWCNSRPTQLCYCRGSSLRPSF